MSLNSPEFLRKTNHKSVLRRRREEEENKNHEGKRKKIKTTKDTKDYLKPSLGPVRFFV
jgi:hypothetical protein